MNIYPANHLPNRKVLLDNGKEYLWFSGTDYLGMGHHEGFLKYLHEGISRYGTHYGSSRNNSLRLNIYDEAELALAKFSGAPAALTVSSGMWAGQLLIRELSGLVKLAFPSALAPKIHYHYAPKVHPALWGERYVPDVLSWSDWANKTILSITESDQEDVHLLFSDSVGSPFVEDFDFSVFTSLPFNRPVFLIVDDSHGFGVLSQSGRGIYHTLSHIKQVKLLVTSSLNKAMGVPGGVILGEDKLISNMRTSPFFSGASPVPPAYMYALSSLLETNAYGLAHGTLMTNIAYAGSHLAATGLFIHKGDYPVFCSLNRELFDFLEANGILASCFSYPNAADPAVTRLVVSAWHQKEDLDRLAEVCMNFK